MFYVLQRALLILVTLLILRIFFPDLADLIISILTRLLEIFNNLLNVDPGQIATPLF